MWKQHRGTGGLGPIRLLVYMIKKGIEPQYASSMVTNEYKWWKSTTVPRIG